MMIKAKIIVRVSAVMRGDLDFDVPSYDPPYA